MGKKNDGTSILTILKENPKYSLFQSANLISRFGDSLDSIAFGWLVYDITKSAMSMAMFFLLNVLPNLIFSLPAGVLADRKSKKRLTLFGYAGRGIVVVLLSFLYANRVLQPWMIFTATFITSTLETLSMPASSALVPQIIKKEHITAATGYYSSIASLVELLGLSVAGFLIGSIGTANVILIDAITFFAAFFIILSIKIEEIGQKATLTIGEGIRDIREAFTYIRKQAVILAIIGCGALTNLAFTPLNVTEVIYVKEILKMGPQGMSLFSAAAALGGILGGWLIGKKAASMNLLRTFVNSLTLAAITYFILGIPAFIAVNVPVTVIIIFDLFLLSFFVSIMTTILSAYLMQIVPQEIMGRVFSFLSMLFMVATPLGSLLAGVTEFIGVTTMIMLASLLVLSSALYLKFYIKKNKL